MRPTTAYRLQRTACGCGPYSRTVGCQSNHTEAYSKFSYEHRPPHLEPEHGEHPFVGDVHFCAMTAECSYRAIDSPDGRPTEGWTWALLTLSDATVCESGQVWFTKADVVREMLG